MTIVSKALSLKIVRALLFYVLLIAVWQAVTAAKIWPAYIFPGPGRVFDVFLGDMLSGAIPQAIVASMTRLIIGYVMSFVLGAIIGALLGTSELADDTLGSLVLGFQSLPSVTWLPLAILWFGLNQQAIIFVVFMGSIFSVAVSVRTGVRGIPPLLTRAARTLGAGGWQLYRYVIIPGMLPTLIQGLKLGWAFAWRSLMAGELLFVSIGIGQLLNTGRDLNNMAMVMSSMLVIIIVGLAVDTLVFARMEGWVERRWGYAAAF